MIDFKKMKSHTGNCLCRSHSQCLFNNHFQVVNSCFLQTQQKQEIFTNFTGVRKYFKNPGGLTTRLSRQHFCAQVRKVYCNLKCVLIIQRPLSTLSKYSLALLLLDQDLFHKRGATYANVCCSLSSICKKTTVPYIYLL